MSSEADNRAAELAVTVYGADREGVRAAYRSVRQARSRGEKADLLDVLVLQDLLKLDQAKELRGALAATQVAPHQPVLVSRRDVDPTAIPETLGGYRLLRLLGVGGMGSVYLGFDPRGKQQVALKVLADQLSHNQSYVDRFYREARSGAVLNHPNIVRCLAAGQDRETGRHFLVMEYVEGRSAQELLDEQGYLSVPDAVHIALDIARALEHAQSRNIIHRDIKPDNILITRSGLAKLTDLGLAKRTDEMSHLTGTRQGFGTPIYMPYEQAINARKADGRSDIYALGATLYHLVTGEVPFKGDNHLEVIEQKRRGEFKPAGRLNRKVPLKLDRILAKMLAPAPRDRYQTASELIVDLERSALAAAVPSFVNTDEALRDPTMRARLTRSAQATRHDLSAPPVGRPSSIWMVRFRDMKGRTHRLRATAAQILERVEDGRLPVSAEAAREDGEFRVLKAYAEFRRHLPGRSSATHVALGSEPYPMEDQKVSAPAEGRRRISAPRWLLVGSVVCLAAFTLGAVLLRLLREWL